MSLSERKLNRWSSHNYNLMGYYFVTLCVQNRLDFFGKIIRQKMILNQYGKIVNNFWQEIPNYYSNIAIDEFVIMPNHIHGLIRIFDANVGIGYCPIPTQDDESSDKPNYGLISKIVNGFKGQSTKIIRNKLNVINFVWQRSFHDRCLRNQNELDHTRWYIKNNPQKWWRDHNN